jgi:glycosyltransferase involved in cell wall biosynthesis
VKKVVFAVPYFHPRVGGAENYIASIAKELHGRGWEVILACGDVNVRALTQERLDYCTVYRLPVWRVISNTPVHPGWLRMLRNIIDIERPDVIDASAPVPYMADMMTLAAGRTPVVVTYHSGSMKKGRLATDVFIRLYESLVLPRTLNRAAAIICSSDFIRDDFLRRWRSKSVTIMPGVDTDYFTPAPDGASKLGLLFVGDFRNPRKGLDVLLAAIEGLPDVKLRVVGPGAPRRHPQAEFLGVIHGEALVTELRKAQVLVLPSTDSEGFGMVLLEAMACATPVVASNIGGIAHAVHDREDGLLVAPGDPAALRQALRSLLASSAQMAELGRAGREKAVKEFSWSGRGEATAQALMRACRR